jgi:molybdopterin synthase sulfur carrier subunit
MARLLYLGRFADIAGAREETIDLPPSAITLAGLKTWMDQRNPALSEAFTQAHARVAINQEIVRRADHPVRNTDEIAFLPPMSGG